MPCNTIQTNTVELTECKNLDLLINAAKAEFGAQNVALLRDGVMRIAVNNRTVIVDTGRLTGSGTTEELQALTARLKVSYSREVVKLASKRFGWTLKQTSPTSFSVVKR